MKEIRARFAIEKTLYVVAPESDLFDTVKSELDREARKLEALGWQVSDKASRIRDTSESSETAKKETKRMLEDDEEFEGLEDEGDEELEDELEEEPEEELEEDLEEDLEDEEAEQEGVADEDEP